MANWYQVSEANISKLSQYWGEWDVFEPLAIEQLQQLVDQYGNAAEKAIDSVIHEEGADEIKHRIAAILPVSGRKWKRERAAAIQAMPGRFTQDNDILSVTIKAGGYYHYLYFPDDGSNTEKHRGNQQFMRRGAEAAESRIIELCLGRLGL